MKQLRKNTLTILLFFGLGFITTEFALAGSSLQQATTVKGKVFDTSKNPMVGVTILLKGTTIGVISDIEGNYTIAIKDSSNPVLIFSFIGMKTTEIPVNGKSVINVALEEESVGLDEVVAIGYATTKKADIVGAVSSVKTDDIARKPVGSLSQSLTGIVPGLIVRDEGGIPGSTVGTFQIRRLGNPLVIVDGMEQSFSYMDPNEIESITVLKDASAAIYGARAGNGVILVTTKRGTEKKQEFNVSASHSISRPTFFSKACGCGYLCNVKK